MLRGNKKFSTAQFNLFRLPTQEEQVENSLLYNPDIQRLLNKNRSDINFKLLQAQIKRVVIDGLKNSAPVYAATLVALMTATSCLYLKLSKPEAWEDVSAYMQREGFSRDSALILIFLGTCWVSETKSTLLVGAVMGACMYAFQKGFDKLELADINHLHYTNQLRYLKSFVDTFSQEHPDNSRATVRAMLGESFTSKLIATKLKEHPELEKMKKRELEKELQNTLNSIAQQNSFKIPIMFAVGILHLLVMFGTAALHLKLTQPDVWKESIDWTDQTRNRVGQAILLLIGLDMYAVGNPANYLPQIVALTALYVLVGKAFDCFNKSQDKKYYRAEVMNHLIWQRAHGNPEANKLATPLLKLSKK